MGIMGFFAKSFLLSLGMASVRSQSAPDEVLNACQFDCYAGRYPDLESMTNYQRYYHFKYYGFSEGRKCTCGTPAPTQAPACHQMDFSDYQDCHVALQNGTCGSSCSCSLPGAPPALC